MLEQNFNMKVCEHLIPVRDYLTGKGCKVTSSGSPWSENCRLWIYFDVYFEAAALKEQLKLDACVTVHEHLGTHDGQESGLFCETHKDGIMGMHKQYAAQAAQRI